VIGEGTPVFGGAKLPNGRIASAEEKDFDRANVGYADLRADLSDVASSVADLESLIRPAKSEPWPTMNHGSACV
jgi:hypothetical protein